VAPRLHVAVMFPQARLVVGDTQIVLATHGLAIVVGVAVGALYAARRAREPGPVLAAAACVTVAALAGSHALFVLLHGGATGLWSGGLASMGGVAAGLATTALAARLGGRGVLDLLDAIAPGALLALAIGRVGCFLGGCCYGAATALPWGVVFPEVGPPARHPLQLYSAAGDVAVAIVAGRAAPVTGAVACRAALGFGLLRAGLETLRAPATSDRLVGPVTLAQAAALVLAGGAAFVAFRLRHREPSTMPSARRNAAHGR